MSLKITSTWQKILFTLVTTFVAFLSAEFLLLFVFNYQDNFIGDKGCHKKNIALNFSYYKPNCYIAIKNWENDQWITYFTNEFGRRDNIHNKSALLKIAAIGDSFTFGAQVPIDDTYHYYSLNKLVKRNIQLDNYGVSGEQAENIFSRLHSEDFNKYTFILYGLTPNDFFSYLEDSDIDNTTNTLQGKSTTSSVFRDLKDIILSTATSRFIAHSLMRIDAIYYSTYLKRTPYSGYLEEKLNSKWGKALDRFKVEINSLPNDVKRKLKIFLLPQRAEVVAFRLQKYHKTFEQELLKICSSTRVECANTNIGKLAKLNESHFPIDGHLTIEGNHSVAEDLATWIKSWQF